MSKYREDHSSRGRGEGGGTATLIVTGNLALTAGTLATSSYAVKFAGNVTWAFYGFTFNQGTTVVRLNGTSGTQALTSGGNTWQNGLNLSGTDSVQLQDAAIVNGTLTVQAGVSFSNNGFNLSLSTSSLSNSGVFTYTVTGTLTGMPASIGGTFVYSGGTVGMLAGTTAYSALTVSGGTITGVTAAVSGSFLVSGGSLGDTQRGDAYAERGQQPGDRGHAADPERRGGDRGRECIQRGSLGDAGQLGISDGGQLHAARARSRTPG